MLYFSGKGCSEFPKKVLILIGILNFMKNPQENKRNWWNECEMKGGYEYIKICTSVFQVYSLAVDLHLKLIQI